MSKPVFKIGLYTNCESDFTFLTSIFSKIPNLNITIRFLSSEQVIIPEKKFSEIPIYIVNHNLFENQIFREQFLKVGSSNVPVICLLDNASEKLTRSALSCESDFWLFKDSLNAPIFESTLMKAEQLYRLKDQATYLRQKFHESEKRFLSVIRSKGEAVIVINTSGLIRFINPACETQFGISRNLIGQVFPYTLETGQIREIDLKPLTGKVKQVEIVVHELLWENENCLTISLRDTTEQKKLEEELVTFRHVIHLSPLPIFITDRFGNILYVNTQFIKTTGYSVKELIGKKPGILKSGIHDKAFYDNLWSTILAGNTWKGEICNKTKGGKLYWEKQLISPVKNARGEIIFFVSIRVDDVERKKKEKERQEAETLKSVQELAGGIAHEFSQPLQVLSISMALMEKDIGKSEYFAKANKMIMRIIELVDSLKSITTLRQQDYLSTKIIDIRASSQRNIMESKKTRILIIDDEKDLVDSLIELLALSGYNCDGVSNGPEALELISKNPYRLIISDIDMPGMGGVELFKRIRESKFDGYFVFMTGYEVDDDKEGMIKLADAFLNKPFQLNELKNIVDKIFKDKLVNVN